MKSEAAVRHYRQRARAESAAATGQRIVAAFLARLMRQWFDQITLEAVAEDAEVTVQTILRRFGGKEGLLSSAVTTLGVEINAQRTTPSGDLGALVDNLLKDYEQTGDAVLRLLALEPRHPALKSVLDLGRSEHRRWAAQHFARWISTVEPAVQKTMLDALVIGTDVYTWKLLRRDMGRSVKTTATTIRTMIEGTISAFTKTKKHQANNTHSE